MTEQSSGAEINFDHIAQNIFLPIYPVIADDILTVTGKVCGRMMDIGCGGGHLGMALLEKAQYRGWFVDISESALQAAETHAQERGLTNRAVFLKQDVHCMDIPDDFADLIVSRSSYLFWVDLEKALLEIYRILAPGGRTYIGGVLGNVQLAASIREKMQAIIPGWPEHVLCRSAEITNEWIGETLDRNRISHEIIDNEAKGRWFVMKK